MTRFVRCTVCTLVVLSMYVLWTTWWLFVLTSAGYTGGGGGFEEPLERQPNDVLKDVQNRYVSIEKAKEDYKVVITKNLEIDHKATEDLRKK